MKRVRFFDSPVLNLQMPLWRSRLVLLLLLLGFVALGAKAVHVQGFSNEFLQEQGERRYERTLTLPATRGKIFDRTGSYVLASSVPVRAIWAIPEDFRDARQDQVARLADLLGMKPADIRQRTADQSKSFVYIQRQVPIDVAEKIQKLKIPGIQIGRAHV